MLIFSRIVTNSPEWIYLVVSSGGSYELDEWSFRFWLPHSIYKVVKLGKMFWRLRKKKLMRLKFRYGWQACCWNGNGYRIFLLKAAIYFCEILILSIIKQYFFFWVAFWSKLHRFMSIICWGVWGMWVTTQATQGSIVFNMCIFFFGYIVVNAECGWGGVCGGCMWCKVGCLCNVCTCGGWGYVCKYLKMSTCV